jgi:hypothetical protein
MIDVHERDRGSVCRRVAAYYIAKAKSHGYTGDEKGARREFSTFLQFSARAERAERAERAARAEKEERAERAARAERRRRHER